MKYRNTGRKIGKYRNTVSKIDEIPIPHLFSVLASYQCPPNMALLSNFVTFLQVRWPLKALTRNVCWNVCNEIQAAHIQSTWRLAEAEFIIINRKNIKLFHLTISGDRKIVLFFISRICLDPAAVRTDKWTLSRDNISNIQLSLADGNFEFFSFFANLSFSFLF